MSGQSLTLLCGPPGSGKSTYAARHKLTCVVLTADAIRDGADPARVVHDLWFGARAWLKKGRSIIVDVCGLQSDQRARWLQLARASNARARIVVFRSVSLDTCKARNAARPNPARIDWCQAEIQRLEAFQDVKDEDWDDIIFV